MPMDRDVERYPSLYGSLRRGKRSPCPLPVEEKSPDFYELRADIERRTISQTYREERCLCGGCSSVRGSQELQGQAMSGPG